MVPQVDPAHPYPLKLHFTAVLVLPVTVAMNCCFAPVLSATIVGEIATDTVPGPSTVTVADADTDGFASRVAVTATRGGAGAVAGAVYSPVAVIEPQEIPAQPLPETLQLTTPPLPPVIVAVNC